MCYNYSYILYIYWVPVMFIKVQALLFTIFGFGEKAIYIYT